MTSRRPLGAIPDANGTRFTVWAEGRKRVVVEVEGGGTFPLEAMEDGCFSAHAAGIGAGARYKVRVDAGEAIPDLASRLQPDGNDGASVVVSNDFDWTDAAWTGPTTRDQVVYELHIGTFTQQGTWTAAREKLEFLAGLGVTVIQIMPIGTFKGAFGWGYDTTLPYAPFAPYGTPEDIRAFVDAAHGLGVGVILDVVYNHVGLGDHYRTYSEHFFTDRYENEWGASFNYDGEHAHAVRDFVVANAVYWITEFHMDGLRIDAAQAMFDSSDEHIIAELSRAVREAAAPRSAYIIVENQPQEHKMIDAPDQGGYGLDGMYNDDFQHAVRVAATGHNDFYYRDYLGTPQEIVSSLKYGFLYHGQRSDQRDAAYGTDNLDTPPEHFIHFLENHDQVANSPQGLRLTSLLSPARLRAVTALLLLGPQTPCLFQGQEFGSSNPFLYFFGIDGDAADLVSNGRKESLKNFPGVADPVMLERLADPTDRQTFEGSKLDWKEAERHSGLLKLHRDLLALRKSDPTFSQNSERRIDGAVLGDGALLLRYLTPNSEGHRVLLLNLGRDLHMSVVAEPLIAPPRGHQWVPAWSSEHPDYDGAGRRPVEPEKFWILPSDCAVLLKSEPR
ncbi:DUF3459 domain-containing protein [Devosia chinhatensis]|uniref:Malto-oligosyltrehalose trehalohydrolase n=1 Tax=Devosia aurantiaca TaxID=2714858 RepID=A0A6M1SPH1_9HYPH|nr:DUF3459 domain-containing protein [Devosia aurantiaca]